MRFRMTASKLPELGGINEFARSLRVEWDGLIEDLKKDAIILASGPYKDADLRRMDHPYARRHGSPRLPLLPININTGRMLLSMRVFRRRAKSGAFMQLQFMVPHSKFVLAPEGTRYMFPRGYWVALQQRYKEHLKNRMRRVRRVYARA